MTTARADRRLLAGLTDLARRLAGGAAEEPAVLSARPDGPVVRVGGVVVKAHPPDTDPEQLARRLRIADRDPVRELLLAPLRLPDDELTTGVAGRIVTAWPAGEPVCPDQPEQAPWEQSGRLLARLHAVPVDSLDPLPPGGAPARVRRALDRLARQADSHPAAKVVRAALATLPGRVLEAGGPPPDRPRTLTHGDWHLGQLVRLPDLGWRLVDVDDLGYGDPAWDLARPASWYATGLLPLEAWARFLDSYRAAGGPAVPAHGDPWPALDVPARALTAQAAALAVAAAGRERRGLDEEEQLLLDACRRIATSASPCDARSRR